MKVALHSHLRQRGHTLLITIAVTAIIGLALAGYLTLVNNENQYVAHSQTWNIAMPVAEAGVEEALTHCYWNFPTNLVSNDWTATSNGYVKNNVISDGGLGGPGKRWGQLRQDYGYYDVTIVSNSPLNFTITSTGSYPMPGSDAYVTRTVQVNATNQPVYIGPLVIKDKVDLNGNNILCDSYDSTDLTKSNGGAYDPTKAGDKGDVACFGGVKNAFGVGNANIWGHAITGPAGLVQVGPQGAVGSVAWQTGGNSGIQSGWWINDLNFSLPDAVAPFTSGTPPSTGLIGLISYDYILGNGNYACPKLDGNTLVTGNAVLYVSTDIKFGSGESLTILPGASLKLYMNGTGSVFGTIDNKNTNNPASFMYFGLNANKTIDINGRVIGAFYAPYAAVGLNGLDNLCGSIVGGSVKLNGNAAIHYDESLRRVLPRRGFTVTTWNEI